MIGCDDAQEAPFLAVLRAFLVQIYAEISEQFTPNKNIEVFSLF